MGSIITKIRDDEDDYELLCKKYNERIDKVYSMHNKWLKSKDNGNTESFDAFKRNFKIRILELDIDRRTKELGNKIIELNKLINKTT